MLKVITLQQCNIWDQCVRSFQNYDTYWLSGYVKAFKINGDGEPILFYYEDDFTRGINVSMLRDISSDLHFRGVLSEKKYFDLATPYGYGGWLIEGNNSKQLFKEYETFCINNSIVSEFVRFHPVLKNHTSLESFYDIVPLGQVIKMDLSSEETIWSNLTSKNRNMIRKAQKNNIKVKIAGDSEIYKVFREIYNSTMDKAKADSYYYFTDEFYESICNDLAKNAKIFYAEMDDQIIAASIMLFENNMINYHLSGSLKEYSHLAPTNLILFEAACWGCKMGYKTLYLGGGVGSSEDGLLHFKKSFNRNDNSNRFCIGKKIFSQKNYEELLLMRKDFNEENFFPLYRA